MIEKLKTPKNINWDDTPENLIQRHKIISDVYDKVNQLVNAVNKLETMAKNTNTVLESLVQENNIHEKQIDELQMKAEPEKCETPAQNMPDLDIQLSWVGHLCRFWDYDKIESTYAILYDINVWSEHPYCKSNGNQYKHCEPVNPDDDVIYKKDK